MRLLFLLTALCCCLNFASGREEKRMYAQIKAYYLLDYFGAVCSQENAKDVQQFPKNIKSFEKTLCDRFVERLMDFERLDEVCVCYQNFDSTWEKRCGTCEVRIRYQPKGYEPNIYRRADAPVDTEIPETRNNESADEVSNDADIPNKTKEDFTHMAEIAPIVHTKNKKPPVKGKLSKKVKKNVASEVTSEDSNDKKKMRNTKLKEMREKIKAARDTTVNKVRGKPAKTNFKQNKHSKTYGYQQQHSKTSSENSNVDIPSKTSSEDSNVDIPKKTDDKEQLKEMRKTKLNEMREKIKAVKGEKFAHDTTGNEVRGRRTRYKAKKDKSSKTPSEVSNDADIKVKKPAVQKGLKNLPNIGKDEYQKKRANLSKKGSRHRNKKTQDSSNDIPNHFEVDEAISDSSMDIPNQFEAVDVSEQAHNKNHANMSKKGRSHRHKKSQDASNDIPNQFKVGEATSDSSKGIPNRFEAEDVSVDHTKAPNKEKPGIGKEKGRRNQVRHSN